jgi:hypothetical protein
VLRFGVMASSQDTIQTIDIALVRKHVHASTSNASLNMHRSLLYVSTYYHRSEKHEASYCLLTPGFPASPVPAPSPFGPPIHTP